MPTLEYTVYEFIDDHNDDPESSAWAADRADILPEIMRAHDAPDNALCR